MANTNMGTKFYISATITPNDLALTDFEAIDDWVEVAKVGNIGETGSQVNILNYDTMDTTVTQKAKGIINAGDPTIECSYVPSDQGQLAMRAAAKTNFNYAFKIVHNDKLTPAGTGTTHYNRGLVAGPSTPNGGVEDFILNVFTLALNQEQLTVAAT